MRVSSGVRLGHVNIEVSNLTRSRQFYDVIFPVLGFRRRPGTGRYWLGYRRGPMQVWLTVSRPSVSSKRRPRVPTNGAKDPISDHLGFWVPSVSQLGSIEKRLVARGLVPLYELDRVRVWGGQWYVSDAWIDPDNNVLELYTLTRK
jgi:catechol 2,3-dioxygenase-like lactoylglutathione lyase family enzyme